MIVKQDIFEALCINNVYEDFGNHTGFRYVDKVYTNLIIGKWYTFKRDEYGVYLFPNEIRCSGYSFSISENGGYIQPHVDFYAFFSTIQAHRDRKIDEILKK